MKFSKTIFTLLLVAISTISCSSDDGTNGIDGVDGLAGAAGAAGATGTANVIYSAWITAPVAIAETIDGAPGMSTFINAPQLSEDILAKGTILVYMSFGSGTFTLPYTSNAGGTTNTITAISTAKKIKLFRFTHSGVGTVNLPTSLSWRYILIPGGVAAATAKTAKLDYSKMSYEEVCAHFNIQQ
ncbi:hypothetical protein NJT12_12675 [Flavobacterium sp. AC]|jgi:hypothetical protein|uniref:Collagen-like protein n=1 Tax=Flavobacterium azizsancarii TaxID=2961580 RepID=A0ABT4WD62_9FLAO|nr:hypothetical protein [Flavobacterium azizsancarii]MDA6070477.1 hypothetical protein [Flavobacterium azizsancarii]